MATTLAKRATSSDNAPTPQRPCKATDSKTAPTPQRPCNATDRVWRRRLAVEKRTHPSVQHQSRGRFNRSLMRHFPWLHPPGETTALGLRNTTTKHASLRSSPHPICPIARALLLCNTTTRRRRHTLSVALQLPCCCHAICTIFSKMCAIFWTLSQPQYRELGRDDSLSKRINCVQ